MTETPVATTISAAPARVRRAEGVRGSLRDSATASVAGIREVRHAAHTAAAATTPVSSSRAATAGSGPTVSGSPGGSMPTDTSRLRSCSARR